jgi:hypothetical protein
LTPLLVSGAYCRADVVDALLAAGGDGLRPVRQGILAGTIDARLWLLVAHEHRALAAPLRAALWRATTRQALPEAAA